MNTAEIHQNSYKGEQSNGKHCDPGSSQRNERLSVSFTKLITRLISFNKLDNLVAATQVADSITDVDSFALFVSRNWSHLDSFTEGIFDGLAIAVEDSKSLLAEELGRRGIVVAKEADGEEKESKGKNGFSRERHGKG